MRKESPIPFTTAMVKAIDTGRKTQTRRLVKPQPQRLIEKLPIPVSEFIEKSRSLDIAGLKQLHCKGKGAGWAFPNCRYGKTGDLLWVKESWQHNCLSFLPAVGNEYFYRANIDITSKVAKWKSGMYMPKKVARLWLLVQDITPEPLQDITKKDALAEGIFFSKEHDGYVSDEAGSHFHASDPLESFAMLWQSINEKKPGCDWNSNPWVWKIIFEKTEKR